jgi:hypothetical protein
MLRLSGTTCSSRWTTDDTFAMQLACLLIESPWQHLADEIKMSASRLTDPVIFCVSFTMLSALSKSVAVLSVDRLARRWSRRTWVDCFWARNLFAVVKPGSC